jgi:hypothetical protein
MNRKPKGTAFDVAYFLARSSPEPNSGCWIWLGAIKWNGYGAVRINKKTIHAHRAAYIAATGENPPPQVDVCHRCDNRLCVNPDHLFAGTRQINVDDCVTKGRFKYLRNGKGELAPAAKLTEEDIIAIRADTRSNRVVARAYGVHHGTIIFIRKRKTWTHI